MSLKPFDPPSDFSLLELKRRLQILKTQSFLPIFGQKRNATIGESLERYLGLTKNNLCEADWGEYELRTASRTLMTLFSFKWNFKENYNLRRLVYD